MGTRRVQIDVKNVPEVMFALRQEMANVLRNRAKTEDHSAVKQVLEELANDFEVAAQNG